MYSELAQKYWDVANAIVAFSVLQMLAFLYSLANKEFRKHVTRAYVIVIVAIAVSWLLYTLGVLSCYYAEIQLRGTALEPSVGALLRHTLYARIGIIGLYSLFGIGILVVARRWGWAKDPQP